MRLTRGSTRTSFASVVVFALRLVAVASGAEVTYSPPPNPLQEAYPSPSPPTPRPTSALRGAFTFFLPGNDASKTFRPAAFFGKGNCRVDPSSLRVCRKYDATSGACVSAVMLPENTFTLKNNDFTDKSFVRQRQILDHEFAWWNENVCKGAAGVFFEASCSKTDNGLERFHYRGKVQCADGV